MCVRYAIPRIAYSVPLDIVCEICKYLDIFVLRALAKQNREIRKIYEARVKEKMPKLLDVNKALQESCTLEDVRFYMECGSGGIEICILNNLKRYIKGMDNVFEEIFYLLFYFDDFVNLNMKRTFQIFRK